jgi:hypothetical protein
VLFTYFDATAKTEVGSRIFFDVTLSLDPFVMGEVAHQQSGIVTGMAGNYVPNYFRSWTVQNLKRQFNFTSLYFTLKVNLGLRGADLLKRGTPVPEFKDVIKQP